MTDVKKYANGVTGLNSGTFTNISFWGLPAVLELTGSKRKIYYNHNEYGFRGCHKDDIESFTPNAAFGCSFTYGYELEEESTWPYLLAAKNYGVNGGSAQTVKRLVQEWIPNSDIETVFVLMPPLARREVYNSLTEQYSHLNVYNLNLIAKSLYSHDPKKVFEWTDDLETKYVMRLVEEFPHLNLFDHKQNVEIYEDCIETIRRVCDGRKLVIQNSEDPEDPDDLGILKLSKDMPAPDNGSRERSHGGEVWNRKVSQIFSRELRKLG